MPSHGPAQPVVSDRSADDGRLGTRRVGSLRRNLLIALGLLFVMAAVVLFFAARSYGTRAADRSYDHLLQSSALSMADSVSLVQGQWQVDLPYAALDLLAMAPEDRAFYRIVAPDGRTITGYGDLPAGPTGALGGAASADRAGAEGVRYFNADYRGVPVRFIQVPRYIAGSFSAPEGAPLRPVWVQVGQTTQAREALANDIVWRASAVIGVLMLATFALLAAAVHGSLRPLGRLEHELMQREASDLRPVDSPVPQELVQVVAALNDFMSRLAVNLDALRTFIAEAAHQMRTPLAALIAQAQDGLDDDDPAHQRRSLQAVERNAMRLRRLVNQLLSDASVAHQGHLRQFEPVDLGRLLREAVRDTVPRADPQPVVRIDMPITDTFIARTRGDALMLREAFKNLIDNALKYGRPDRGPIDIALREASSGDGAHSKCWCVTIADHGLGIAVERRQSVFERFVRHAGLPVEGMPQPAGAGLGLAIVRRVIDSHQGSIELRDRDDGLPGLQVRLLLPMDETLGKGGDRG